MTDWEWLFRRLLLTRSRVFRHGKFWLGYHPWFGERPFTSWREAMDFASQPFHHSDITGEV